MRVGNAVPWLGRFVEPLAISAEGAFRLTAARDLRTGHDCVVVAGAPTARPEGVRAALQALHDAHARIDHPGVARPLALSPDGDWVAFDCPARTDLAGLLMIARAREVAIDHGAADGFIVALRDAIFRAFATPDAHGHGHALRAISYGNLLFAPDGRFWLLGFGHNVAVIDEHGRMGGRGTAFQAPEVAIGSPPTQSSEFVALLQLSRALVPFMRLRPAIVRVLTGRSLAEDFELMRKLVWFERRVIGAVPEKRASCEQAIATSDRIRTLLGVRPDVDAFRRTIAAILAGDAGAEARLTPLAWRVAADGSRIERAAAATIEIPGRGPLRRIVTALAAVRVERPGASLTVEQLVRVGWPGERMVAFAGKNRVHVAVSTLRKLGLGSDIESNGGAYRVHPAVFVELIDEDLGKGVAV